MATATTSSPATERVAALTGYDAWAAPTPTAAKAPVEDLMSEMRLANLVQQLFFQARESRRNLTAEWKKNYQVLNNRQYTPNSDPWTPSPQVPKIWPIIASLASWMTDQRPIMEAVPTAPAFSPYADFFQGLGQDMTALMNTSYMMNGLSREISMTLWDVLTYGVGYLKACWEPWLADGKGDAVFRRTDPYKIFPDPNARTENDLSYIIEAHVMTIDDADRAFPGTRAKMGELTGSLLDAETQAPHRLDAASSTKPRYNLAPLAANFQQGMGKVKSTPENITRQSPMVTVLECWVRSHKHEGDKTIESWTCIVTCGNRVLMHEDAWDINAFGTHPYSKMNLFSTGEWYGPALVSLMSGAQNSINRILAAIETNIDLVGNPMLIESRRSTARNRRITNRPGARLEAEPQDVAWLQPPQMHPQMAVMLLQYYASELESISGMSAIVRGFSPTGRNAQGVIDSVQDSAFVRVRGTLRELELVIRDQGNKMMATIAEFYDEPRMTTVLGPDGTKSSMVLKKNHFYDPSRKEPLRFALLADAGSELSTSRQALAAQADQAYALGQIDRLEALKAKRWPNYKVVANRVDQAAIMGTLGQPGQRQASRA